MNKATSHGLGIFAVKVAIAAIILSVVCVATVQVYKRLDRQNILVEAIINDFRQANKVREKQLQVLESQRELPAEDDPVPTEDKVK